METLASKYRPKGLAQVVGQEVPIRILSNSIALNKIHHSYLLVGQFGSGKTTVARILASLIHGGIDPRAKLDMDNKDIRDIFNGESNDVVEIDAASNRKKEDAIEIKKQASYAPLKGHKKIFIIDEVHMFTTEAFNAMLKLIEEPPDHVIFIFCTTEAHKVPDTIMSRCQRLDFGKLDWREMSDHIVRVCKHEDVDIPEEVARFIAKRSSGSMRNALTILEKVLMYCGEDPVTIEAAQKTLGSASETHYYNLLNNIFSKDVPKSLLSLHELMISGGNAEDIFRGLQETLRNLLNVLLCSDDLKYLSLSDDELKGYQDIVRTLASYQASRLVAKITGLLIDVRRGMDVNMDLQTLLGRWAVDSVVETYKYSRKEN